MNRIYASVTLAVIGAQGRLRREEGQSTVEYVLVLVFIAALVAAVFTTDFSTKVANKLSGLIPGT